ncbi:MAG: LLM class flavin-dependent oxidoreductase [Hyphomicrobiaceae bacterium]
MRPLEFGWYLPTHGDTVRFNDPASDVTPSLELFERVVGAAEGAGFEYLLIPVGVSCWEAYMAGAYMAARHSLIRPLIAARPGYINPVMLAKMISTLDHLSKGRISVNLIAGQNETDVEAEGVTLGKSERYELMEEEVRILKALWTASGPLHFDGKFHSLKGAEIRPRAYQKPHPRFYLGGGSKQAWDISARHSDVHLFWGDTPERISANVAAIRSLAAEHGRGDQIGFGMRLQIICRQTEDQAWAAAEALIAQTSEHDRDRVIQRTATSEANRRIQDLAREKGPHIAPHLWSGLTRVRQGAGIAIVGDPSQCASVIQQFIDAGCHSFCLSGYLHDEEAERFGRLVRPIIAERNPGRLRAPLPAVNAKSGSGGHARN